MIKYILNYIGSSVFLWLMIVAFARVRTPQISSFYAKYHTSYSVAFNNIGVVSVKRL